jgi:hypothetical protein
MEIKYSAKIFVSKGGEATSGETEGERTSYAKFNLSNGSTYHTK